MRRKKKPRVFRHGNKWRCDTYYRGIRLRESFATEEAAEENLRKVKTLIDEGRYLEKKKECKEMLGSFAGKYLQWCKDIKQKAVESKRSHLESINLHFGEDTALSATSSSALPRKYPGMLRKSGPPHLPAAAPQAK